MKVSVVIPAYNEEKYLEACLKSLLNQSEKADEIIVVDNNSIDTTAKIAKSFGVRLIKEKKQGMIPARNCGFNAAKYEIIARTDADTQVPKDWIKRIKKNFQNKSIIAVSGPARFYDGIPDMVQIANWPSKILFFKLLKKTLKHDCLYGPNMSLRKSAWESVKYDVCLEDSEVHEDIDLSMHLAFLGKIKFDKRLVVSSSFRRFKKLKPYFEYPYRAIKTIRKHKDTLLERQTKKLLNKVYPITKKTLKGIRKVAATVRHPMRYL